MEEYEQKMQMVLDRLAEESRTIGELCDETNLTQEEVLTLVSLARENDDVSKKSGRYFLKVTEVLATPEVTMKEVDPDEGSPTMVVPSDDEGGEEEDDERVLLTA